MAANNRRIEQLALQLLSQLEPDNREEVLRRALAIAAMLAGATSAASAVVLKIVPPAPVV